MKLDIQIPSYYTEQNMFSSVSPWENFHLSVGSGSCSCAGSVRVWALGGTQLVVIIIIIS